jgi:hypothetical protein
MLFTGCGDSGKKLDTPLPSGGGSLQVKAPWSTTPVGV